MTVPAPAASDRRWIASAGTPAPGSSAGGSPFRQPSTPAEALELFLRRVDRYAEREPNVAAHLLGGLAGPGVDERRRSLATRVPEAVLAGLAGQDDEVSWELRQWLWEQKPRATALTLLGLPAGNRRAAAMRAALADLAPTEVATSLRRPGRRGGERAARAACSGTAPRRW